MMVRRRLSRLALLAAALAAALALAGFAVAEAGHELEIRPTQEVYSADEDVVLTVKNNGTAPAEGTPSFEVRECSVGGHLCQDPVASWTGEHRQLAPGESFQVTWDKRTDDGDPAPEGAYVAHLTWEGSTGTQETESPAFSIEEAPASPDRPVITVHEPRRGEPLRSTSVHVDVTVQAKAPLRSFHASVGDKVLADRNSPGTDQVHLDRTVELSPGVHVLAVQATDEEDRTNRTTLPLVVAPQERVQTGPLEFAVTDDGAFENVRVDGILLFERIDTSAPTTRLHAEPSPLGLGL